MRIGRKRVRRIKKIVEIVGIDPTTDDILTNEVFSWNPRKDSFDYYGKGHVLDNVAEQRNWTDKELSEEFDRRKEVIRWMVEKGIKNYVDVGEIIAAYYKNPEAIMKKVMASESYTGEKEYSPLKSSQVLIGKEKESETATSSGDEVEDTAENIEKGDEWEEISLDETNKDKPEGNPPAGRESGIGITKDEHKEGEWEEIPLDDINEEESRESDRETVAGTEEEREKENSTFKDDKKISEEGRINGAE